MGRSFFRLLAAGSLLAAGGLVAAPAAHADAPQLACGATIPGPCQETVHFSSILDYGTPLPVAGCPDFVQNDYVVIAGTGNGVEHINVNKAQDWWTTGTFTGSITVTPYAPSSVQPNDDGTFSIIGPPDAAAGVFTGKLTEWFGGAQNNKSMVFSNTMTYNLSNGAGIKFMVKGNGHSVWTPNDDPNGPPHVVVDNIRCQ